MFCFIRKKILWIRKNVYALNLNLNHCLGLAMFNLAMIFGFVGIFFLYYDCNTIIYNFHLGLHGTCNNERKSNDLLGIYNTL